jgi:O-antigen/teichoic acid export membrane protein
MTDVTAVPGVTRSLRQRATRGTILTVGGQFTSQFLRMVGNLALSRLLFPEAFGLMTLVSLVLIAVEQVFNFGTYSTVIRHERGDEPAFLDTAWTIGVGRAVILWIGASAFAPVMARFYAEPLLASMLPVALFSIVIASFASMKLSLLDRRLELERRVAIDIAAQIVAMVLMVALSWAYRSVWALLIGGLANNLVRTVASHVWLPGRRDRFAWDRSSAHELIHFGKWVFASSGLSFAANQLDVAILGRLVPLAQLGVYTIGMTVPNLLREVLSGISSSVLMPALSEANRSSGPAFRRAYEAARRVTLPVGVIAVLASVVVAPAFFDLLYDARYENAEWVAQLGALRLWFGYLQVTSCFALFAYGDARTWALSSGVATAAIAVGCLVGFHVGGLPGLIIGLGFGTASGYVVAAIALARQGIGSPRAELVYTCVGTALVTAVLVSSRLSALVLPDLRPALRTLLCGTIVSAPFALWTAVRTVKALQGR